MKGAYFIGIDIGTQGARVALIDVDGNLIDTTEKIFQLNDSSREEQSPDAWWLACLSCLKTLMLNIKDSVDSAYIKAISVTSTSGTIIPMDGTHRPLHNAIMYSDKRSAEAAKLCKDLALKANLHAAAYKNFNSSCGLSKMVWYVQTYPDKIKRLHQFIHASDYIIGKLCGYWGITDYTNALKSGYDIQNLRWPTYIYENLPIKKEWLQAVVPSGTPIALLLPELKKELDINNDIEIVVGMTDGCASQVASGAVKPGQWNTTIGTTLVVKGVTRKEIIDPQGVLYNHRHPDGYAMPGGASNTGADWITGEFDDDLARLNKSALQLMPSEYISWPLRQQGERFPIIAPHALGFEEKGLSKEERFVANLEGVAYIERYAYEMIEQLSGEKVEVVYTAGGGSNNDAWLKIRSNVLNLSIHKMKYITGAVGAAIVAASKTYFNSLTAASDQLTQIEKIIEPERRLVEEYDKGYKKFLTALVDRGYLGSQ